MESIKKYLFLFVILISISIISASNCPSGVYPCDSSIPFVVAIPSTSISTSTSVNYSLVNVNNSDYLDSIDSTGFCQMNYQNYGGTTISNNLTVGNSTVWIYLLRELSGAVGTATIKWSGGSRLTEQDGSLKRMLYLPNGDRFEVLNEQGNAYIATYAGELATWPNRIVNFETLIISNRSDYSIQSTGIPFPRQSLVVQNHLYVGINNTGDGSGVYINDNMTINNSLNININLTVNQTINTAKFKISSDISGSGNITTSGYIGIGTATPAYVLDVYGNVFLHNTIYTNIINAETYTKAGYFAAYDGKYVNFALLNDSYGFLFKNTTGTAVVNISSTGVINTLSNFSVKNNQGLTKTIKLVENVDLSGMTKTFCNQTFTGGIITNTSCGDSEIVNLTFINSSCLGTDKVIGMNIFGKVICGTDITGNGTGSETDPIFSANFTNMQTQCPTNYLVKGYYGNGTPVCVQDQTGSSSLSDSDFEREEGTVFFEPFFINTAIETGEVGIMGWNYVSAGGGSGASAVVSSQGNHIGQLRLSTGTTASGNITLDLGTYLNFDSYTGNITYEFVFNLSSNNTITQNYSLVMGFGDNLGTTLFPVDGIFFLHNLTYPNWTAVTSSNNGRTYNITNIQVTGGSWQKFRIDLINKSSDMANFYINNQLVAQNSLNIPQGSARAMGLVFTLRKTGGTTTINLDIDYVYYKQIFQVTR